MPQPELLAESPGSVGGGVPGGVAVANMLTLNGGDTLASPEKSVTTRSDFECDAQLELECIQTVRKERLCCIGAGYVGGPTMAVIADKCPELEVYVADISTDRIAAWNGPRLPIYEPGLDELVTRRRGKNLFFTSDVEKCIRDCDIIFLAVNTPTKAFGLGKGKAADMTSWELASRSIAKYANTSKIIIEKSTVPVRTADSLSRVLYSNRAASSQTGCPLRFAILSNPEFLAEGTAINDLLKPDRVLVGGSQSPAGEYAVSVLADIYSRWVPRDRIITTNTWSSELSKLVANAYLGQRVSSINSIAMLCEKCGADVREVAKAVGADSRIGGKFLNPSIGFGGSCLQKDILSLAYLCDFYGLHEAAMYWQSVKDMNDLQKTRFARRVLHGMFNTVNKKKIAVFGFAFKKDTGDVRATPAVDVCQTLMSDGAILNCYDPKVQKEDALLEFKHHQLPSKNPEIQLDVQFNMVDSPESAVDDAHAIIVLTEWDVFKAYDYASFYERMQKPAFIFDGRNLLNHTRLHEIGFEVHGVGVPSLRTTWEIGHRG